jgi:membrane-bound serine protease (ClpP class)
MFKTRLMISLSFVVFVFFSSYLSAENPTVQAKNNKVYLISIKGSINPGSGTYIIESIKKANQDKVKLLVIELDTPGGLVETTRMIVQEILSSDVPIAVNVTPPGARAGSAGVMITMAAHLAAMAPSTNIGAAHPVAISPGGGFGGKKEDKDGSKNNSQDAMTDKMVNDVSAFVEGIAKARGRNFEWAIESVRKSSSITSDDALKNRVIDFIAKDTNELIKKSEGFKVKFIDGRKEKLDLKNVVVEKLPISFKLKFLSFIADPNLAYLLMMLAALGIYLEFSNPGLILPGVAGSIAGILAMMSFQMLPINTAGIVLLLVGLILIGLEFFVAGSGILAGGGSLAIILGGVFLIDTAKTDITVATSTIVGAGLLFTTIVVLIAIFVLSVRRKPVRTGYDPMIGLVADVIEYDLKSKQGKLIVSGEIWNFITEDPSVKITDGEKVTISSRKGMVFIVRKQ